MSTIGATSSVSSSLMQAYASAQQGAARSLEAISASGADTATVAAAAIGSTQSAAALAALGKVLDAQAQNIEALLDIIA